MSDKYNAGSGRLPQGLRSSGKRDDFQPRFNTDNVNATRAPAQKTENVASAQHNLYATAMANAQKAGASAGNSASAKKDSAQANNTRLNAAQLAAQNAGFEFEIDYATHTLRPHPVKAPAARTAPVQASPQAPTQAFQSSDFNLAEGRARLGIEKSGALGGATAPAGAVGTPTGATMERNRASAQASLTNFSPRDDGLAVNDKTKIPDLGPADEGMPQHLKQVAIEATHANPIMQNRLAARAEALAHVHGQQATLSDIAKKSAGGISSQGTTSANLKGTQTSVGSAPAKEGSVGSTASTNNMQGVDDPDLIPIKTSLSDEEVPNQPGAILRHAREMLGLSQREIAMRLKLQVNSISDIEHDRLNQPTAAAFARGHIANYARLVNIDPKVVVALYDENVAAFKTQAAINTQRLDKRQPRRNSHAKRYVYGAIFLAIVAGLGINYIYTSTPDEEPVSETLVLSSTPTADTAEVSGELNTQASGSLNVAGSESNQTPAVVEKPVDLNTLRAQQQAEALGTNELTEEDLPPRITVDTTAPLLTTEAPTREPAAQEANPQPKAVTHAASPTTAAPAPTNTTVNESVSEEANAQPKPAPSPAPVEQATPVANNRATAAVIVDNQQNGTEGSLTLQEPAPALSGNLQDVSSRVSVRNRDGLASLNSASIAIRGKVFLRITDSRGKVLASGNYDTGDNVRVTGIPPIKVEVTDSSRINISYMGGTLVVPAARQVSFTLPQR